MPASRSAPSLLYCAVLVALLAAGCGDSSAPDPNAGAQQAARAEAQPGQVPVEQLFARANTALQEQRMFDPANDNAFSMFLEVSQRHDAADGEASKRRRLGDSVGGGDLQQQAKAALSDMFPYGIARVEQALRAGELEDAGRVLGMLERVQPDAGSVKRLRESHGKAIAAARAALRSTDPDSLPPLISKRTPKYPSRAERQKIEGWVHMSYVIKADGSVGDVKVMAAEPDNVFDREAVAALQAWKYEPPGREIRAQWRQRFTLD